ncbi:M23 family metallopeptidase [Ectothiorhodospira shaposhnikovii]|uniref:M23 family metallopeptidase n=1 Tax=Ectothiorhodospira shaposhnikovii TaxID=1054 RepID=UPI001EE81A0D|nr:M23 family metallopeptidase [Ectothiorhodospira shaposhnikovii]MCG5513451.1 M23 family metallopeptidase [Ectothiorhodospira shaposhnikovii]
MNIIFLTDKGTGSRRFHVSRWYHLSMPLAALTVCGGLILGAGYQAGRHLHGTTDPGLAHWSEELREQRYQLEYARDTAEAGIQALTQRVAQLQAQMMRLEALGNKLVKMADLEDGEFDFGALPGLGGPEELLHEAPPSDLLQQLDELARQMDDRESQLRLLSRLILSGQLADEVTPGGRPVVSGWMSSGYGTRTDPFTGRQVFHRGVDFAGRPGSDIIAVAGGIVIFADRRDAFGKLVEIDHGNGYVTRYAHNQEMLVSVGDTVRKGQVIARMGSTGRATGPHVHFEVLKDGRHVNPHRFIAASG